MNKKGALRAFTYNANGNSNLNTGWIHLQTQRMNTVVFDIFVCLVVI